MPGYRITVVDDDESVLELLDATLAAPDYAVKLYRSAHAFRKGIARALPGLLILDVCLQDANGFDLLKDLRRKLQWKKIPVIFLSGRANKDFDVARGIELGAEDYISKPFSPTVLAAKVRAILRRLEWERQPLDLLTFGDLIIDPTRRRATLNDKMLDLTRLEFNLLTCLLRHAGKPMSRKQLLKRVWGVEEILHTRTVDKHIQTLREKLGPLADCIETVPAFGYRFNSTHDSPAPSVSSASFRLK